MQSVEFVGGENHRFARFAQNIGDFIIERGGFFAPIAQKNNDVGLVNGELGRTQNGGRITFLVERVETAGINEHTGAPPDFDGGIKTVARGSGIVLNEGNALAREAIKKMRFPNVGATHDGNKRFRHKPQFGKVGVSIIKRAANVEAGRVHDMKINHRGRNVFMAEQILHAPHVITGFEQMGGERMTQHMGRNGFGNARAVGSDFDGALHRSGLEVVDFLASVEGIARRALRGKNKLPLPAKRRLGILALQGGRQVDRQRAHALLLLPELTVQFQMSR